MRSLSFILLLVSVLLSHSVFAQKANHLVYDGNKAYIEGKPMEAANFYRKALKEKQDFYKANFNLGDALYKTAYDIKTGKIAVPDKRMTKDSAANLVFNQSAEQFEVAAQSISNPDTIQRAWHNYGNAKLMQASYEDAILGYKKALKLNPKDEDTRYNLAYAQRELKKQQDKQKKDDKKDDKKDKKDDKKDKGDPKEKKDQAEKEKQQQPQMSKEQAEQMLKALQNHEKKMQSAKVKKGDPAEKRKIEKDW